MRVPCSLLQRARSPSAMAAVKERKGAEEGAPCACRGGSARLRSSQEQAARGWRAGREPKEGRGNGLGAAGAGPSAEHKRHRRALPRRAALGTQGTPAGHSVVTTRGFSARTTPHN